MSSVDERVVKMVFDNSEFMSKIAQTITGLTQLNKSTEQIANSNSGGLNAMSNAFEKAEIMSTKAGFHLQDVWLKVASIFEYQIAGKIVSVSKQIANAMTFEGINDGFKEYELKMGSVQTIMAGTGESLSKVNQYLEELNAYSDKTIYSFADMTNNIGKFTNAGVKLEDAVAAIKGIANEAAISGANANEASRAMYNFSQALSAGYVKLIDWKSIENANMATQGFKDTLLEVASTCGTVEKDADGMYKVLSTSAQGGSMKEAISATKNFNDSLSYQWMTTDVLTKALKIYATDVLGDDVTQAEREAYEEELRLMGMSEEQIKKFEELGHKATLAASEVKTFSMLIDTLKEAIGSGWAQTWEILIGDFEEAKAVWTKVSDVLGGIIDKQSKARNELLKGWDKLGGRIQLLTALENTFNAVLAIVKPVSQAMKDIFPPITAQNLITISKGLKEFTAKLTITEETAKKIRSAAKGFFAIFDIGLQLITGFLKVLFPMTSSLGGVASKILDVAASVGEFLAKVDYVLKKAKVFETVFTILAMVIAIPFKYIEKYFGNFETIFNKIVSIGTKVFSLVATGVSGIITLFGLLFSSFTKAAGPMANAGDIFKNVFDDIEGGLDNFKARIEALEPFFNGIKAIFSGIGTMLGTVFKQMGESISGISFGGNGIGGLMNIFNALISGGILLKLYTGIKRFSEVGGILDSLGDALDSFGKKVGSETLLNTAKAVAILAGSLFVVAMIDSEKLTGATTAISVMVGTLAGAMALLMKAVNSFSTTDVTKTFSLFGKNIFGTNASKMIELSVTLGAVSKALISMGAAVLMMSVGLKIVSSAAKDGHLWDSFAVISLMLGELTAVGIVLSKFGGDKAVKGLTSMTAALVVMAVALGMVAKVVEGGNAWQALGILSIMLGELAGVALLVQNFGKYKMSGMTALISLAISLNLCVMALKSVSDALGSEGNHIWESLAIITIMLAELAAITVVMSKFGAFAALGGVGAIMAAAALLILVQALKQISDALGKTDQHIWQALGVIAVSLITLAIGLAAMATGIPGAAALLIASAALIVLGGALKIMGSLSLKEIGKGLLAMAGSLLILAAGLTAMILALPGAVALVVACVGLTELAGVLKLFSGMSLKEVAKGLLVMVAALVGMTASLTALSVFSPFILLFSIALTTFGVALIASGVGMTFFAAGLQALVAVMPMGIEAFNLLATTLLNLIPVLAEKLLEALGIVLTKIVEYGPAFTQAAIVIIGSILDALSGMQIKIADTILNTILGILQVITEHTPEIAQAGTDMIVAFMDAVATETPRLVDSAYKCAIEFINGLADAISNNNTELIAAVDNLMTAVIQAITQWIVAFTPLGFLIPQEMKDGIMTGEFNVKDAMDNIVATAIDAVKGKIEDFKEAAKDFIGGFISGLEDVPLVGKVVSAAASLGSKAVEALRSEKGIDAHSDSVETVEAGHDFGGGFVTGTTDKIPEAEDAATLLGSNSVDALDETLTSGSDDIMATINKLVSDVKNAVNSTETMTYTAKSNAKAAHDQAKAFNLVNEELENNMTAEEKDAQAKLKNTKETEKNTEATETNTKATSSGTKATKKSADVMDYASGIVEAFTEQYGHLYSHLGDDAPVKVATIAIKNLAEQTYLASLKAKEATEMNEKTTVSIEDMIKEFTQLKSKVYDSVKSMFEGDSFFQKFELKTEKTMGDLLEGMRSNVNAVKDWSNKLVILGTKGVDQGLLKQLGELGPKGYEYVNAFVNASADQIAEANALFAEAGTLPDTVSNTVVASYAMAGLNAVAGFANGVDENTYQAATSMENLGLTGLKALETALEEQSPSRATYRDGGYLCEGLANGINNFSFLPLRETVDLCTKILEKIEERLNKNVFYEYGKNIALGLAEGMTCEEAVNAVMAAAEFLNSIADSVTTKYNQIESPSKRYAKYGKYIAAGFGEGMVEGTSYVESGAMALSDAIRNTMETVKTIAENDMEMHPVISPVLDIANLKKTAGSIGGLFPSRSLAMASSIGIGRSYSDSADSTNGNVNSDGTQISFVQNNYSPKALNRYEIYRQTKNQISMVKGVIANA